MNIFQLENKEIKIERDDLNYSIVYLHKRTALYILYEEKFVFNANEINKCDLLSNRLLYL
jgi:hypothetical protein